MNIQHHPSDIVLWEFASSSVDEAGALVLAAHIAMCPQCQKQVRRFEAIGGSLLDDGSSATDMKGNAESLLEQLDLAGRPMAAAEDINAAAGKPSASPQVSSPQTRVSSVSDGVASVARILDLYKTDEWRWIGPGVHYKRINVPGDSDLRAFLLKASPGTRMPSHNHSGVEWTCVLQGAFGHHLGRFQPGDFEEADDSVLHQPVVEAGEECICLVAMNGQLVLQGILGRMMQPFVRI